MNDVEILEGQIRLSAGRFLLDLQSKYVNEIEFEKLDRLSQEFAAIMRTEAFVPKTVLRELYMFVQIARRELPYLKEGASDVQKKVDVIERVFETILRGESE